MLDFFMLVKLQQSEEISYKLPHRALNTTLLLMQVQPAVEARANFSATTSWGYETNEYIIGWGQIQQYEYTVVKLDLVSSGAQYESTDKIVECYAYLPPSDYTVSRYCVRLHLTVICGVPISI